MGKSIHIAALDLGSSAIKAMVARKDENGILSILASEQIKSDNCIRRGYIFNSEETTNKVSLLIKNLNKKLDSPIEKIYVGVGGQSLRSEPYSIKREVSKNVAQELIDSLTEEAWDVEIDQMDTLAADSLECYLDGQLEKTPTGAICSEIEARFQLLIGKPTLKSNLLSTIRSKVKLDIVGLPTSPLATAKAVLSDREKELGCALVEFGAGITYVSIYKGGLLRYLVTIPLGGDAVTKDIRSLNILEAEEVKLHFSDTNEEENLKEAIDARRDEILANVVQQIKNSGYEQSIENIVITGGAAQLKNLPENLRKKSGKEVRLAYVLRELLDRSSELSRNPANSCVIGLLALGTEECLKEKEIPVAVAGETDLFGETVISKPEKKSSKKETKETNKEPKVGGLFTKIAKGVDKMTGTLFGDEE